MFQDTEDTHKPLICTMVQGGRATKKQDVLAYRHDTKESDAAIGLGSFSAIQQKQSLRCYTLVE